MLGRELGVDLRFTKIQPRMESSWLLGAIHECGLFEAIHQGFS